MTQDGVTCCWERKKKEYIHKLEEESHRHEGLEITDNLDKEANKRNHSVERTSA